jgi:hypothetical protein
MRGAAGNTLVMITPAVGNLNTTTLAEIDISAKPKRSAKIGLLIKKYRWVPPKWV